MVLHTIQKEKYVFFFWHYFGIHSLVFQYNYIQLTQFNLILGYLVLFIEEKKKKEIKLPSSTCQKLSCLLLGHGSEVYKKVLMMFLPKT